MMKITKALKNTAGFKLGSITGFFKGVVTASVVAGFFVGIQKAIERTADNLTNDWHFKYSLSEAIKNLSEKAKVEKEKTNDGEGSNKDSEKSDGNDD